MTSIHLTGHRGTAGMLRVGAALALLLAGVPGAVQAQRQSLTSHFSTRAAAPPAGTPSAAIRLPRPLLLPPPRIVPRREPTGIAQRAREVERGTGAANHRVATGEGRWLRYDLSGRGHRDSNGTKVPTPHVVEERANVNVDPRTGSEYVNRPRQGEVRAMTHGDLRTLERALRERRP